MFMPSFGRTMVLTETRSHSSGGPSGNRLSPPNISGIFDNLKIDDIILIGIMILIYTEGGDLDIILILGWLFFIGL